MLQGRDRERTTLDELLNAVRAGESRALVIEGEAGVGKSVLLDYVRERATECRLARAAGVQSEMELAFAGLHQLCAPMLDRLDRLPGPQRDALATAFGLARAEAPDRFLVGLAVLSLLSEAAAERPLVCLVDDAQWLDLASVETLGFVARRLIGESVALVFAVREGVALDTLAKLPRMRVEGLSPEDANALLRSVIPGPLDEHVAERIVAETHGNPLALLELPRGLSTAQLAGGFGLPVTGPLTNRIERSFQRRLEELPPSARWLLLVAATEPVGDSSLVWRAARRLGIDTEEATATTTAADLLTLGTHVRFRHPLVRSAVYRSASVDDRRAVHEALAEETDAQTDPDRRAWHRAEAAAGPNDAVAAELERSAGRAQARGGLAAAAAFLERAVALTDDPGLRTRRAFAAARAAHDAGAYDTASALLATAERGPLDELERARAERLRARIGLTRRRGSAAPKLLLRAAQRLEPLDAVLARETYFEALGAALTTGHRATLDAAVRALLRPPGLQTARAAELLMIGQALMVTKDRATATPVLERALEAFRSEPLSGEDELRALAFACIVAVNLWDDEAWVVLSARHVELARGAGALTVLPTALELHAAALVTSGKFGGAQVLLDEADAIATATGSVPPTDAALLLAGWQGDEATALGRIAASIDDASARGEASTITIAEYAAALLFNALGRSDAALAAAQRSCEHHPARSYVKALVEMAEAAARSDAHDVATEALERLRAAAEPTGTDWAIGVVLRTRALVGGGTECDLLYQEAIERLGRTHAAPDLARAHLLYGEWLRRGRRRADARPHLRAAHEAFAAMGARAFADRAARELLATGETARRRGHEARTELTPQELQVARLARDGLSNPEIGARLFISRRTVQYHLHKVFAKLDITSRTELELALDGAERERVS